MQVRGGGSHDESVWVCTGGGEFKLCKYVSILTVYFPFLKVFSIKKKNENDWGNVNSKLRWELNKAIDITCILWFLLFSFYLYFIHCTPLVCFWFSFRILTLVSASFKKSKSYSKTKAFGVLRTFRFKVARVVSIKLGFMDWLFL